MSILENIELVKKLENIAKNHPLGGWLHIGQKSYIFQFLNPFKIEGFWCKGTQKAFNNSKKEALTKLIKELDEYYNNFNRVYSWHKNLNSLELAKIN